MRAAEAETMWSEKVNSLHLRGTPTRAGGQTRGGGGPGREVCLPDMGGVCQSGEVQGKGGNRGGDLPARGGVAVYFGFM